MTHFRNEGSIPFTRSNWKRRLKSAGGGGRKVLTSGQRELDFEVFVKQLGSAAS
jgi:hypothetical protein